MREINRYAICIDYNFCISKYKFKLVTIVAVGPLETAVPVATLICSRENHNTLKAFCEAIQVSGRSKFVTYKLKKIRVQVYCDMVCEDC